MRRILTLDPFISKIKLDFRNLSNCRNIKKIQKNKLLGKIRCKYFFLISKYLVIF